MCSGWECVATLSCVRIFFGVGCVEIGVQRPALTSEGCGILRPPIRY